MTADNGATVTEIHEETITELKAEINKLKEQHTADMAWISSLIDDKAKFQEIARNLMAAIEVESKMEEYKEALR